MCLRCLGRAVCPGIQVRRALMPFPGRSSTQEPLTRVIWREMIEERAAVP
jgi:hypothetical protein